MTVRSPLGWQVILADLSLILFISTAGALDASPAHSLQSANAQTVFSARMEGDDLAGWLAAYSPDARERLRIVIHYRPGGLDAALTRAAQAVRTAAAAGQVPSLTLEEGPADGMTAIFAFDEHQTLARKLQ